MSTLRNRWVQFCLPSPDPSTPEPQKPNPVPHRPGTRPPAPMNLQICEFAALLCSGVANLPQLPWARDWRKLGSAARTGIDHMWPKQIRGHLP